MLSTTKIASNYAETWYTCNHHFRVSWYSMIGVNELCNFVIFQANQFSVFTSIYFVSSAPTLHCESFHVLPEYISFVTLNLSYWPKKAQKLYSSLTLSLGWNHTVELFHLNSRIIWSLLVVAIGCIWYGVGWQKCSFFSNSFWSHSFLHRVIQVRLD